MLYEMRDLSITLPEPPLNERIKALRRRLGLSMDQFAAIFAISPRTLQDWEQGRRKPRGLTLRILEKELAKKRGGSPLA
jgi:DNA-binding transcriptional regulator YiaG